MGSENPFCRMSIGVNKDEDPAMAKMRAEFEQLQQEEEETAAKIQLTTSDDVTKGQHVRAQLELQECLVELRIRMQVRRIECYLPMSVE